MRLMVGEAVRREEEALKGVRVDIDGGLRGFLEAFPGLIGENVLVTVFKKGARAVEGERDKQNGRNPEHEVVPPFEVEREEGDEASLADENGEHLLPKGRGV